MKTRLSFIDELGHLLNRYSMENTSNTPDFMLAQYLRGCLALLDTTIQQRETWYGRDGRPTYSTLEEGQTV